MLAASTRWRIRAWSSGGIEHSRLGLNIVAEVPGAYYTESHVMGDPDLLPEFLPSPGDFADDLPREILRDLGRHVGLVDKLFRHIVG